MLSTISSSNRFKPALPKRRQFFKWRSAIDHRAEEHCSRRPTFLSAIKEEKSSLIIFSLVSAWDPDWAQEGGDTFTKQLKNLKRLVGHLWFSYRTSWRSLGKWRLDWASSSCRGFCFFWPALDMRQDSSVHEACVAFWALASAIVQDYSNLSEEEKCQVLLKQLL